MHEKAVKFYTPNGVLVFYLPDILADGDLRRLKKFLKDAAEDLRNQFAFVKLQSYLPDMEGDIRETIGKAEKRCKDGGMEIDILLSDETLTKDQISDALARKRKLAQDVTHAKQMLRNFEKRRGALEKILSEITKA